MTPKPITEKHAVLRRQPADPPQIHRRRVQILTLEQLLKGAEVDMPPTQQTFKLPAKAEAAVEEGPK